MEQTICSQLCHVDIFHNLVGFTLFPILLHLQPVFSLSSAPLSLLRPFIDYWRSDHGHPWELCVIATCFPHSLSNQNSGLCFIYICNFTNWILFHLCYFKYSTEFVFHIWFLHTKKKKKLRWIYIRGKQLCFGRFNGLIFLCRKRTCM